MNTIREMMTRHFGHGTWLRGPDCQCKDCQKLKRFTVFLRDARLGYNLGGLREANEEALELGLRKKPFFMSKRHYRARKHYLMHIASELGLAVTIYDQWRARNDPQADQPPQTDDAPPPTKA